MSIHYNDLKSFQIHFLRAFGIIFLILAHVKLPIVLFQLRNFNVILLVLIAGAAFSLRCNDVPIKVLPYLRYRIARLIIPCYVFLIIFFLCGFLSSYFFDFMFIQFDYAYVIKSFLLNRIGGIQYLWIIAIYLIVAGVAPLAAYFNRSVSRNPTYFLLISLFLILHELMVMYLQNGIVRKEFLSDNYLFYIVPYSCVFAIGVRLQQCQLRSIVWFAVGLMIIFVVLAIKMAIAQGQFVWTQAYKYPPQLYYMLYALAVSLGLYAFVLKNLNACGDRLRMFVLFVSKNSLWIYLWHIPGVMFVNSSYQELSYFRSNFILAWLIIIAWALFITFFQRKIIEAIIVSWNVNQRIKDFLKIAFL